MKAIVVNYHYIRVYLKYHRKYRLGLFIKLIYFPIQMLLSVFLWISITSGNNLNLNYMIMYYMLVNLLAYAFPFASIAKEVEQMIMEGTIHNYLVRPINLMTPLLSKYISWMIIYSIVFIPALGIVVLINDVTIYQIIVFVLMASLGMFIEFILWINVGYIAFYTGKIKGAITAVLALRLFLSGALLPLSFFPPVIQRISFYLPFRFYIFTPVNQVLTLQSYQVIAHDILLGLTWIIILSILRKLLWCFGIKRIQNNMS